MSEGEERGLGGREGKRERMVREGVGSANTVPIAIAGRPHLKHVYVCVSQLAFQSIGTKPSRLWDTHVSCCQTCGMMVSLERRSYSP